MKQWNWCKMLQIRGIQYTSLLHDKLICTKLGHNIEGYLPSLIKVCTLERLSITFTSNGKCKIVPCDQVSPLLVIYYSLFRNIKISSFTHFVLSKRILFWAVFICSFSFLRNSQLDFAVICNDKAPLLTCISVNKYTKREG